VLVTLDVVALVGLVVEAVEDGLVVDVDLGAVVDVVGVAATGMMQSTGRKYRVAVSPRIFRAAWGSLMPGRSITTSLP